MAFPTYQTHEWDGFKYIGDYDEDPDDQSRKMWHTLYHKDKVIPLDSYLGPYEVPSLTEIKDITEYVMFKRALNEKIT